MEDAFEDSDSNLLRSLDRKLKMIKGISTSKFGSKIYVWSNESNKRMIKIITDEDINGEKYFYIDELKVKERDPNKLIKKVIDYFYEDELFDL